MVVDLLRPGSTPISQDKIRFFEFLLDQKLLEEHLRYPNPEPSATDLIVEFLSVDVSNDIRDGPATFDHVSMSPLQSLHSSCRPNISRKQLALKVLALKVASSLNWNLDTFEAKLTPFIQRQLLQDLVFMAADGAFSVPPQEISINIIQKPHMQFALTLYHRWILRYPAKAAFTEKFAKLPFMHFPSIPLEKTYPPMNLNMEKILKMNENDCIQSIKYLEEVIAYYDSHGNINEPLQIRVPVMDTFTHMTEDMHNMVHNWDAGSVYVSQYELLMQIHFDLCYNYFFYGHHEKAKKHILGCRKNQKLLEYEKSKGYGHGQYDKVPWGNLNYASVSEDDILGYIRALNMGQDLLDEDKFLLQRLRESVTNDYKGIIAIFQADNLSREIPMIHRQLIELDIQAAASTSPVSVPKDLMIRVSALNAVRYTLEGGLPSTFPDFLNKLNTVGVKFFDILFWALAPVLVSNLSEDDWNKLRMFFLHLATSSQCRLPIDGIDEYLEKHVGDRASEIRTKLICEEHLKAIIIDQINIEDKNMDIPCELLANSWDTTDFEYNAPELDIGRLKKRLVEASSTEDVRICLVQLATMSPSLPLWKHNPYCKPIGNLRVSLAALPRAFLQDFCAVMSGAAQARLEAGDARSALSLLSEIESEARNQLADDNDPVLFGLCRALAWEMLLLQVNLLLSEWPHHRLNATVLTNKCKAAIAAADSDADAPRSQVVLGARLGLLNMCEWELGANAGAGAGADAAANAAGVAAALCAACAELQRGKGMRKLPRRLWDHVLNTFNNSIGCQKRLKHTSHHLSLNYADHCIQNLRPYDLVVQGLREPLAISVVLSLLAKIYNVLVDDPSMELVVEYTELWPNNIANINSYKPRDVLESLIELLERSLKLYPYNSSWLRLYGDAEMAAGRHAAALRRYLCALSVGSQHFATRAPDEDGLVRRAARCCQTLAAPTQAAALCQLPGEPDYTRAFKCLTEKIANAADSMDAYYGCLWNNTLLEVSIATHARRGETGRRARAITAIGALELNANNSDEIQREAAAGRRARLLRALTDQYVC
ncbi:integrator complex subunit 8-like [Cydia splendana]|uniref:integrator complex subunit 8-like n=1 Tax=Cydia splendana TaxID=1100963 RepID=UPI0028F4BEEB